MTAVRTPAVSGTFYPALPGRLRADLRDYLSTAGTPRRAFGVVAPHAGYMYSGATAGVAFAAVEVPATCVVLAPNHTGRSASRGGASLLAAQQYRTPLGEIEVDDVLAQAIVDRAGPLIAEDATAHAQEHAVEVILPFLQTRNAGVRIVPLVLAWPDWERTRTLAHAIVAAIGDRDDVLVVASTDMNHYEPASVAEAKDTLALERVTALDGEGLLAVTSARQITMCGRVPAACACEVARARGATHAEVVAYSHSGLVNGDHERVVGYAAVVLGPA